VLLKAYSGEMAKQILISPNHFSATVVEWWELFRWVWLCTHAYINLHSGVRTYKKS